MVEYIFSPQWFYGIDSLFEIISVIVAVLIGIFSYRAFNLTKQKRFRWFSLSFFMIALAFIFKIISNIVIYARVMKTSKFGFFTITYYTTQRISWFHPYAFLIYMILMFTAFMVLLIILYKINKKWLIALLSYFVLFSIYNSFNYLNYHLFHLTLAAILLAIVYYYYDNYKRSKNIKIVGLAFLTILISQVFFVFVRINPKFYVIGEFVQLLGFLVLLYSYILILRK